MSFPPQWKLQHYLDNADRAGAQKFLDFAIDIDNIEQRMERKNQQSYTSSINTNPTNTSTKERC